MKLGDVSTQKVRHIVALHRELLDDRYRAYEAAKEKRAFLRRMREKLASAETELREISMPLAIFTSPQARERAVEAARQNAVAWAKRVAEIEAEVKKFEARHDSFRALLGEAGPVAANLVKLLDDDERILREELDIGVGMGEFKAPRIV